jgi:hypothetical protein
MPDPKLKTAAAEIEAILQRHDIAGIIMLNSLTHMEFLMCIAPSWSCCWIEDRGEAGKVMRVKALRADYPSKEAHSDTLKNTVGMIMGFVDCCESMTRNLTAVAEAIARKVEFSHFTREEQNPPLPPDALGAQDQRALDEWLDGEGETVATTAGVWHAALAYERQRLAGQDASQ